MAKLFKLHIYSDEQKVGLGKYSIRIYHEFGNKRSKALLDLFREEDIPIVQNIEPPGEKGGGGDTCIFPLYSLIGIGLLVFIAIPFSKSFFKELGKSLAKKIVSVLFDNERAVELHILNLKDNVEISMIVPAKTGKKHFKIIIESLEGIKKGGKYLYIKEIKKLKKISD